MCIRDRALFGGQGQRDADQQGQGIELCGTFQFKLHAERLGLGEQGLNFAQVEP